MLDGKEKSDRMCLTQENKGRHILKIFFGCKKQKNTNISALHEREMEILISKKIVENLN